MSSEIDEFLDHVDKWKLKLHDRLKHMTPSERKSFWSQVHDRARERGMNLAETDKPSKKLKRKRKAG